jgi:hypothetical protein
MIYVPNRIRISTYGGDLGHHRLRMEGENQKSSIEPPANEERRKKEKKASVGFYAHPSHQFNQWE